MSKKSKIVNSIKKFVGFWSFVKLLLILICAGMFYWNSSKIINRFMEYSTIVLVEYKQPNMTQVPAVTLCAYSFMSDEYLLSYYWEEWNSYINTTSKLDKYSMRHNLRAKALKDNTVMEIFDDNSITFESIVEECFFYRSQMDNSSQKIPCTNITSIVESIYNGLKCFTIFSHLNTNEDEFPEVYMEYELQPYLQIKLTDQSDLYSTHLSYETTMFCIHSPNIIPTTEEAKCFLTELRNGIQYDMRFKKQVSYLMPPPYITNCKWYNQHNPPGERSLGDCLNRCEKKLTFKTCFHFLSIITRDLLSDQNQKICAETDSDRQQLGQAKVKCSNLCQISCIEEVIEMSFSDYTFITSNDTLINIRSSTVQYEFRTHKEVTDSHDFIGYLGGHAHIWLGLSALKIFNWFVHLIHYIRKLYFK